jgi:hypothetical protein
MGGLGHTSTHACLPWTPGGGGLGPPAPPAPPMSCHTTWTTWRRISGRALPWGTPASTHPTCNNAYWTTWREMGVCPGACLPACAGHLEDKGGPGACLTHTCLAWDLNGGLGQHLPPPACVCTCQTTTLEESGDILGCHHNTHTFVCALRTTTWR